MMPGMNEKFATLSGQLTDLIELQKDTISILDRMEKKSEELVKLGQGLKQQIDYMNKTLDIIGLKVSPEAYPDEKKPPQPLPTVKKPEKPREPPHEPTDEELEEGRIRKQMLEEAERKRQAEEEGEKGEGEN